ncbi:histidine phosphatase family protein [Nocardia stercoris]|uniref:MSMEG_4193 family putative phosphomutase n=1 Tax=Nocardia stercoris TaxID=2483361 RepID=A0A3M2L7I0_9NOCA|nr:histidine phosphatase family protein [Nocardia stercoris]RMI33304.1 MSMEG_4193 family putative phosphomutase [Nocardia stercoris]
MTVILLRHGVSTSNTARTLAGRSPGVDLTDQGREQARSIAARLGELPIGAIVHSPLLRCTRTVAPLADKLGIEGEPDEQLIEVDYGEWTGRALADLISEPLWKIVQRHASGAVFPGGEGLADVQYRAVAAIRSRDRELAAAHGGDVLWVACTHGDVIKSVIADAYGMHLDSFQRIVVEPASISVIRYTPAAPMVWRVNDTGSDLSALAVTAGHGGERSGPVPGGEVGARTSPPPDPDNGSAQRSDAGE